MSRLKENVVNYSYIFQSISFDGYNMIVMSIIFRQWNFETNTTFGIICHVKTLQPARSQSVDQRRIIATKSMTQLLDSHWFAYFARRIEKIRKDRKKLNNLNSKCDLKSGHKRDKHRSSVSADNVEVDSPSANLWLWNEVLCR